MRAERIERTLQLALARRGIVKSNEKLKLALLQSATALFIHFDKVGRKARRRSNQDAPAHDAATARDAARLAVALWDELGAALSTPHGQAQLRS